MRSFIGLAVLSGMLWLVPGTCEAQGGGIPPGLNPEMIKQRIRDELPKVIEASPSETLEVAGLCRITYKKIPTSPSKIATALGQSIPGIPAGINIDQYIGMFQDDIQEMLNEALADVGTFEALQEIKIRSKRIPKGSFRIGILFEGERPRAIQIFSKEREGTEEAEEEETPRLEKPVELRMKTQSVDLVEELTIKLKEPKKQKAGKEKCEMHLAFLRFKAKAKTKLEAAGEK